MADKLNYKVGMIGALDMLRFKNMPKVREKAIQAASSAPLPKTLTTNEKAKQRHPEKQEVIVAEIRRNALYLINSIFYHSTFFIESSTYSNLPLPTTL